MKLSQLAQRSVAWLTAEGPLAGIVISSRIRLARNLAGYPFLLRCDHQQRLEIQEFLSQQITTLAAPDNLEYINIDEAEDLDRQLLVERRLISHQHAKAE